MLLSFGGRYPEEGLPGHMVTLFLIFWGTSILFSTVVGPVYILAGTEWGFIFPHSLSNICDYLSGW